MSYVFYAIANVFSFFFSFIAERTWRDVCATIPEVSLGGNADGNGNSAMVIVD